MNVYQDTKLRTDPEKCNLWVDYFYKSTSNEYHRLQQERMVDTQIRPLAAMPHQALGRGIGAGFTQIFSEDARGASLLWRLAKGIGAVVGRFFC